MIDGRGKNNKGAHWRLSILLTLSVHRLAAIYALVDQRIHHTRVCQCGGIS